MDAGMQLWKFPKSPCGGCVAVHCDQKPGSDWRGETAVAGTAGVSPACCDAVAEAIESGRLAPTVFVMVFGCRIAFAGETPNAAYFF